MIYSNLLSGDADADGDGLVPPESAFNIVINDSNPANGRIVDGCGTFTYTITPVPGSGIIGFTNGSGSITAADVSSPVQVSTAVPRGPFLTPHLASLTINTLPVSVSRSFIIDRATTIPRMSTLDPQLMTRLLAGGDIPRFTDGCSDIKVVVKDVVREISECGNIIITRTFTATDESTTCSSGGPSSSPTIVSYDIVLERPRGSNVQPPAPVVNIECNNPDLVPGVNPPPAVEDRPFLNGPAGPIYLNTTYGNVGASFSDSERIQTCTNTYKFVRTWTVIDWCDPDNVRSFSQLVKVGDTSPPTLTLPTQDLDFDGLPDTGPLVFSTNAPGCGAVLSTNTNGLRVTDLCSSVTSLEAFVLLNGNPDDLLGPINVYAPSPVNRLTPFLPAGPHVLRYVATDQCGNEAVGEVQILIEDRSGPVIIAEDALNVSLSNSGFAEVAATDVDRGSYDDCSDIVLEIAFANPATLLSIGGFGPSITLTCIDVGAVPVILRATDANGNQNQRMSVINVVDNSAPLCIAPGSVSLSCTEAATMLPEDVNVFFAADPNGTINMFNEMFGLPTSLDNCGNELTTQTIFSTINDCGTGQVTRVFTVTDARGFTSAPGCQQIINVGGVRNYTLEFPADASATCGFSPSFNNVVYTPLGCDMVVSTMDVDTFFATSDACFKIRRTIEVINWCEYDGIGAYYNVPRDADNDGNFNESTFLHIVPNGNTNSLDDVAILDRDGVRTNANNIGFLDPNYATSRSRGAFRYVQFLKVFDDEAPILTHVETEVEGTEDCNGGDVTIEYNIYDACSGATVTTTAELDLDYAPAGGFTASRAIRSDELTNNGSGNYAVTLDEIPAGEHALRVRGFDGCGNTTGRIIPFTVADNAAISPICVRNLTFVLMNDGDGGGIASVEADDYVVDVTGNCNNRPLRYSVYREEEEAGVPGFVPMPGRGSFLVNCEDEGEISVRVYVFAENGQSSFCATTARITAFNPQICANSNGTGSLAGFITSPTNELLRGIEVHISDLEQMDNMMYTDDNGSFLFNDLMEGHEYMIRPSMPDQVDLARVKTSDIFKITNHVLGIERITNPYRLIAADVNADGVINISDMVAIRRVILGLDNTFTDGPTWRFIRRSFSLDGLQEGWDPAIFPSTFTVDELRGHNREADFVAIEIGDVFTEIIPRSDLHFTAQDQVLKAGERATISLGAADLAGFQGTLDAAPGLVIENWHSTLLSAGNVNAQSLQRGLLAISYNGAEDLAGREIIRLDVRADINLRISDYLRVSDRVTFPEAIAKEGGTAGLRIAFEQSNTTEGLALFQNYPNPVFAQTTIEFDLPSPSEVSLEVRDITGRLLKELHLQGNAGRNSVMLSSHNDLMNATGIFTYTLRVGQERLTKRMTVVAH
ncbi:T9SS type A sorting domain-containing protein [Neolewinella lacunae]|uniref:T9SS type A sorting domain-containing protein n=1 Tax=Neolewinella lacunae TaxID=1517758 RepID=A0A923PU09_9BACT|nr:T9SS type A sorting domain-containing protein [Neolewinella lacunae]MBC6996802.1 T9SS type A sorting domain-containing protein [Neolewinella lacunae]MDN3637030.1 T9SS type A sorting domain-containing protein [Neolewinella lacunae]